MCFAFRGSTSADDLCLEDIVLIMFKAASLRGKRGPAPPPASTTSSSPSEVDPEDCVMVEPPKKNASSAPSQGPSSLRRSEDMESENGDESDESDDDEKDESAAAPATSARNSRKRQGSTMVNGPAKRAKAAPVLYVRPAPSGKGDDYDDLRDRANTQAYNQRQTIERLELELSEMQNQRDEAFVRASASDRNIKSLKIAHTAEAASYDADLKAALQELRAKVKAEWEKKNKASTLAKDQKHKQDIARYKDRDAQFKEQNKGYKAEAKELKPEHSKVLKKRDQTILALKETEKTLGKVADDLKHQIGQLKTERAGLSQALADKSDEILVLKDSITKAESDTAKAKTVISSYIIETDALKKAHSAEKKAQGERWQIQYDNAQDSARRASDVQRSMFPLTTALNQAIQLRIDLEGKLKMAEAEMALLRKGEGKAIER